MREERAALVDRVTGVGVGNGVARAVGVDDGECEAEDRLLAAERGDDFGVRVELDAETARCPADDRLP